MQGVHRELQSKRRKETWGKTKLTVALDVSLDMGSAVLKTMSPTKSGFENKDFISLTHNIMNMNSLGLAGNLPRSLLSWCPSMLGVGLCPHGPTRLTPAHLQSTLTTSVFYPCHDCHDALSIHSYYFYSLTLYILAGRGQRRISLFPLRVQLGNCTYHSHGVLTQESLDTRKTGKCSSCSGQPYRL